MIKEIIIITLLIVVVCIIGRILFGSSHDFWRNNLSFMPLRIHHGYIGLLLMAIYIFVRKDYLMIAGASMFFADLLTHILVLPLWVGSPEFP